MQKLLKGCQQHFRAGVIRVSNISQVIAPADKHRFRSSALGLLQALDHNDFLDRAAAVVREFPACTSWLEWWLMPERARKLFPTELRMEEELAKLIPDHTNAAESQHNKLYLAVGKKHSLELGLRYLVVYMVYFTILFENVERKYRLRPSRPVLILG